MELEGSFTHSIICFSYKFPYRALALTGRAILYRCRSAFLSDQWLELTLAVRGLGGALLVCGGVERARPAGRLTPLRLVEALGTGSALAHVALPKVARLARDWK